MDQSGDSPPPLLPHQHHRNNTVVKGLALPRTLSSRHRLGHVYLPTGYGPKKMAAGGMGPRAFAASCAFALVSFARGSRGERYSNRAAGCPWGSPWGRGARVEVRRVVAWGAWCQWPRGAWVLVPSPHHVLLLWCLLPGLQEGQGLQIGLLVALGECHGSQKRGVFQKKGNLKKCFHVLEGSSECAFPVSDQESI